jgi:type IV pilus assembly protein PilP
MRVKSLLLCALFTGLLAGCGSDEHEDIKGWMAESSRDLRGRAPPLPELKPFPVVSYEAAGDYDPFSVARVEPEKKGGGGRKPDFERPREQLENFPLESLQFVGVMSKSGGGERHALIKVDGVVYRAGKGNYVGQDFGRIVEVSDSEVVLVETVQDPSGQSADWVERQATLQMREGAQGKEANK